jgi:hypothetical protein
MTGSKHQRLKDHCRCNEEAPFAEFVSDERRRRQGRRAKQAFLPESGLRSLRYGG